MLLTWVGGAVRDLQKDGKSRRTVKLSPVTSHPEIGVWGRRQQAGEAKRNMAEANFSSTTICPPT